MSEQVGNALQRGLDYAHQALNAEGTKRSKYLEQAQEILSASKLYSHGDDAKLKLAELEYRVEVLSGKSNLSLVKQVDVTLKALKKTPETKQAIGFIKSPQLKEVEEKMEALFRNPKGDLKAARTLIESLSTQAKEIKTENLSPPFLPAFNRLKPS